MTRSPRTPWPSLVPRIVRRACFCSLLLPWLALGATAQAACLVDLSVANWWEEEHGFVQKARVEGLVRNHAGAGKVRVHFRARFRYERADGWAGAARGMGRFSIDTRQTRLGNGVVRALASLCGRDQPCWVNDVEIRDVRCVD